MSEGTSREDAEEAALDALFGALSRLPVLDFTNRPGLDPLFNYLVSAALNSSRDRHRGDLRKGRTPDMLLSLDEGRDSPEDSSPEEDEDLEDTPALNSAQQSSATGDAGLLKQLREFLKTLSPEDQLILHLHAHGSLSSKEIGQEVGLKSDAVRKRVERLHDRFRTSVAAEEAHNA